MIPGPRAGWPTEIQRLGRNKAWKLGRANSAGGGQRVAPRNFNNGYCLDTGSVTGLIKWRKPPLGAKKKKKKKKRRHGEKSGGSGEGRTSERRERTAYGCSLVNVFRAYYLLVIPYTTLAAPPSSRSMLLLLPFFFWILFFFFFFTISSDIRLNGSSYFFPLELHLPILFYYTRGSRGFAPILSRVFYLFISLSLFFLFDDNDEPLSRLLLCVEESQRSFVSFFFFISRLQRIL